MVLTLRCPFYRKATEVDPTYANAFFDVGRCLYLQAQKIIDDNPNATNKELVPKIKPIYDEAIPFLEKASQLNPDDTKARTSWMTSSTSLRLWA